MKWYMQRLELLETIPAFNFLQPWQQQLVRLSFSLWQREYQTGTSFMDYSHVLFHMSKAYEGFLKQFLLETGLIDEATFKSKRFRIGRALNPDVRANQRDEYWLYDSVAEECTPQVARQMWDTWLKCRNRIFHYFPGEEDRLTLEKAGTYLEQIFDVMQEMTACQVRVKQDNQGAH